MDEINCTTEERDIIYNVNYPLGSYPCNAEIFVPEGTSKAFFSCEDRYVNRNEKYVLYLV